TRLLPFVRADVDVPDDDASRPGQIDRGTLVFRGPDHRGLVLFARSPPMTGGSVRSPQHRLEVPTVARYNVMTAIPYVNGRPHVGHALELVQADVLARHRRQCGDEVRFQTGTDDNALKNVQGAQAQGITVGEYVASVAERFAGLGGAL